MRKKMLVSFLVGILLLVLGLEGRLEARCVD